MIKLWNGKKQPKQTFQETLQEIDEFSKFAKQQTCPNCHKKDEFKVAKFERGKQGWELIVVCKCGLRGVLNPTGFSFAKIEEPKK